MICAFSCAVAAAQPGRAKLDWITSSETAEPGKPLQTAIRMTHDEGWHSYWINPGVAGIPTKATWKLPQGWETDGLEFPVPIRFLNGGLAGYGYKNTVLFPVTLTPPPDFDGVARLSVTITWLACGEAGCVPGEKELHLDLRSGTRADNEHEANIRNARRLLPVVHDALQLEVSEKDTHLELAITGDSAALGDLSDYQVYASTPEVIDAQEIIHFQKNDARWVAKAPLSEFAKKPIKHLEIVLHSSRANSPLLIMWSAP